LNYRKEIDGLRAIAVLPVILFHAKIPGFSGGFIGVDIFFVISGFLITSIIIKEISENKFSIVNFYKRRARRILPALSGVLLVTTLAAYILMPASFLENYSKSLVSVVTFSSNIFFYLTNNYFSTSADLKPLLHTWSLAIEEQFYFIFPLMLVVFWPIGKKRLISSIVLISVLSLILSQYLAMNNFTNANFYFISSRAWELLSGSIIAFMPLQQYKIPSQTRNLLSSIGLLLIAFSIFVFNQHTPFPGFYTLLPVLGTSLILIFCNTKILIGRLLASKILVAIGLISYSLYLWHQPLLAFLRLKTVGEPSIEAIVMMIFFSFVLAFLSWKFVELPFRYQFKNQQMPVFKYSLVSIAFFLVIGMAGYLSQGFESRFEMTIPPGSIQYSQKRQECHTSGKQYLPPDQACEYFAQNISWASFGDSHIVEPTYALAKRLEAQNIGIKHLTFSACSPALSYPVNQPGCSEWIEESLSYLENNAEITHVLLGFRYSAFLHGGNLSSYPKIPDRDPVNNFPISFQQTFTGDPKELYWQDLKQIINRLLRAGKHISILYPIPEIPVDINIAVLPFSVFGGKTIFDLEKTTTAEFYRKRNAYILDKLDKLPYGDKLEAIKPFDILCDGQYCPAVKDNKALYFDFHHLSLFGSEVIAEYINLDRSLTNQANLNCAKSDVICPKPSL